MSPISWLRAGDRRWAGPYLLTGRVAGQPRASSGSADRYLGQAPDGTAVLVTLASPALPPAGPPDPAAPDRFAAAALAAQRIAPYCVARILDAGVEGSDGYLVTEYLPGPTLAEVVADEGAQTGPMLLALAAGTVTGLAAIHQAGLAHGEFGPGQVVLGPGGPQVVLAGLAGGSPAADMRAWAETVLYCALGRPPVGPQDLAGVDGELGGAVAACLAPEAAGRPAAQSVLARLLGRQDLPTPTTPIATAPAPSPHPAPPPALTPPPATALPPVTAPPPHPAPAPDPAPLFAGGADLARAAARGLASGPFTGAAGPITGAAAGPATSGGTGLGPGIATGPGGLGAGPGSGPGDGAGTAGDRHSHPGAHGGQAGRTRRLLWGTAAAVCLLALVAGVTAIVRQQTAPPAGTPPATLAGSWSGPVHQTRPALSVTVLISLPAGPTAGTIAYPALHCSGSLAVVAATPGQLTLHQTIHAGRHTCRDGDFTLAAGPAGTATFSFQRTGDGRTSGTLTRPGRPAS